MRNRHQIDTFPGYYLRMPIKGAELERLRLAYKAAVDQWVAAIREEEALATPDYSLPVWERWDQAGFHERDAQDKAKPTRKGSGDLIRLLDPVSIWLIPAPESIVHRLQTGSSTNSSSSSPQEHTAQHGEQRATASRPAKSWTRPRRRSTSGSPKIPNCRHR